MKTLKNIFATALLFSLVYSAGFAQEIPNSKMEQLKAYKVEFITTRVNLTSKEAQIFWPVYNEFSKALQDLKAERLRKMNEVMNGRTYTELTDADVLKLIDIGFLYQQKELDLKKVYDKKFKEVLPIKKVGLYYKTERDFKKEVIKRLSGRNRQGSGR